MLKSIVFLLVLVFSLTTPTRAYEAYNVQALTVNRYQKENLTTLQPKAEKIVPANEVCSMTAAAAEKKFGIKQNLLQTIAMVESGRWNAKQGKRTAWPWTVHANGRGYYFGSKQEAVAAVKALQKKGINNIDVGCMQINLKYHGTAFKSLEDAFEPEKNIAYSAAFLKKLYKRNKADWKKTAMHYHSKNRRKGINYKNRLEKQYTQYISTDETSTLF